MVDESYTGYHAAEFWRMDWQWLYQQMDITLPDKKLAMAISPADEEVIPEDILKYWNELQTCIRRYVPTQDDVGIPVDVYFTSDLYEAIEKQMKEEQEHDNRVDSEPTI